jgi:hypothetical protein
MRYSDLYAEIQAGTATATLPGWAGSVLQAVADQSLPIDAVCHPLGFLCLPVERSGPFGVCLHLWSPDIPTVNLTTSPVHCHGWELISFVLYGQVANVLARLDDGGSTHQVFEVTSRGDRDELRATDRKVGYQPARSDLYARGEVYSLPAGVFHRTVIPGSGEAATVVLGRDTARDRDQSLGPLAVDTHLLWRRRCGALETARAARRAAARLASSLAC